MRSPLHVLVQALPALTTFLHPLDRPSRTSENDQTPIRGACPLSDAPAGPRRGQLGGARPLILVYIHLTSSRSFASGAAGPHPCPADGSFHPVVYAVPSCLGYSVPKSSSHLRFHPHHRFHLTGLGQLRTQAAIRRYKWTYARRCPDTRNP